jgi:hypothetical protein
MWASSTALAVTPENRRELEQIARSGKTEQRIALRARIVLGAADGRSNNALASWLNLVERWFEKITTQRIRRGTFISVSDLVGAINDYIKHNNAAPKPFIWTKSAAEVILKVNRGRAALKMPALKQKESL